MHVTPDHEDVAPPIADGRYRLVAELGRGGMATVYQVWDSRLHVARALKLLAPALSKRARTRERFESEARLMARLHHPNLVTVHDVGHDPGGADGDRAWMVMELLSSGSLADVLLHDGPLAPDHAAALCRDVLGAVQVAHDAGVIHRDIKPHNILLAGDGTPKITDFGIARASDRDISLTRTGAVMGTWAFMAPEIRSDAKQADERSDIYAMGATLYMLTTGRQPLDLHASNVRDHILSDLPPALRQIIETATEYHPDQRYPSARAMGAALSAAIPALGSQPAPTAPADGDEGPSRGPTTLFQPDALPSPAAARSRPPAAATMVPDGFDEPVAPADLAGPAAAPVPPETPAPAPSPPAGMDTADSFLAPPRRDRRPLAIGLAIAAVLAVGLFVGLGGGGSEGEAGAVDGEAPTATAGPAAAPADEGTAAEDPPAEEPPAEEPPAEEPPAEEPPAEEPAAGAPPAAQAAPVPEPPAAEQPAPRPEPRVAAPEPAPEPGLLRINSLPPAMVSVDGGAARRTPVRDGISLAPGTHRIRFETDSGTVRTTTVTIQAGKPAVLCWDLDADGPCPR